MKVAFRADASLQMGSGHVMRCLTLAQALAAEGVECHFICREHSGNLIDAIVGKGFKTHILPAPNEDTVELAAAQWAGLAHAHWLGVSQSEDAAQTSFIIQSLELDWLIVDHYGLDATWEESLKPFYKKLMVIDDLADRHHVCDLLLDQNLGRDARDYASLVPDSCKLMIGPQFALLRPEFSELREYSLKRRASGELKHILITMGGADLPNTTEMVIQALLSCGLPKQCQITVVMGPQSPWIKEVMKQASRLPWRVNVEVNVTNMAGLMAEADLCIGAAGSSSWERCTLGLPCILVCIAENQRMVIKALAKSGAAIELALSILEEKDSRLFESTLETAMMQLSEISACSATITDGCGVSHILQRLLGGE